MQSLQRGHYSVSDLVFALAPRLNAAGRMEHGELAVRLLIETDPQRAAAFAARIESMNTERRDTDQTITEEALEMIRQNQEETRMSTVVFNPQWHKGVIGIVASRLIETYYRPTLVFTKTGDRLAASARSVRGFDIYKALEGCSECIEQFGGHTYAAGLTLDPSRFEEFKARFEAEVDRTIDPAILTPEVQIDLPIRIGQLTPKLYRILSQFAPFGPGNPRPVFASGPVRDSGYARKVGSDQDHLKLAIQQEGSQPLGAIGFGLGGQLSQVTDGQSFEIAYSLEENRWQGRTSLQLKVRDIHPLES
jgi:single-stranded-DNA-specific exonuclease